MKIAFAGKGGTGKTTLSAALIRILAKSNRGVLAVDCDPDSNLGRALGFEGADEISPIIEMEELIRERMGVSKESAFFKMNPKIDDIPDKFSMVNGNVRLIIMGAIKKGGAGCTCAENAFVKNLIEHLVLRSNEDVVMDMEAGVEHFGRATAAGCDAVVVVVEPSHKSIESAGRVAKLAKEIGIKRLFLIANKVRGADDERFIRESAKGAFEIIAAVPFVEQILVVDKGGGTVNIEEVVRGMEKALGILYERIGR